MTFQVFVTTREVKLTEKVFVEDLFLMIHFCTGYQMERYFV
jgi:hypothetical protein